ncbi:MAG: TetR/AcrR family transcriptional regulator [Saprospiraceae bacterium]
MKKSDKTRQFIIDKAADLFNTQGFSGTSMSDIMEATGLSKGAIYGNFKRESGDKKGVKEEIAIAAFEHAIGKVLNAVGRRTRIIENTIDKLKAVVYYYKERILNPPVEGGCPIQNTAIEMDDNHIELRRHVVASMDRWQERLIYTLQKGKKRGEVRVDLDEKEFAINFIATLEGGIMLTQLYKDNSYFNPVSRQLLRMIEDCKA